MECWCLWWGVGIPVQRDAFVWIFFDCPVPSISDLRLFKETQSKRLRPHIVGPTPNPPSSLRGGA